MDWITITLIGYGVNFFVLVTALFVSGHWVFVDWNRWSTVTMVTPYGSVIFPLIGFLTKPWRE